jgi:ProP effector
MTMTPSEASAAPDETVATGAATPPEQPASAPAAGPSSAAGRARSAQPVLEKLFELYPHLFGANFLPLKLGIFQELLAAHPELFQRDSLKAALAMHTRSTRYLQCVTAGNKRHDLQGQAGDDVAPEHVYLSLLELFRRRQARAREDLRPRFRAQLMAAFEASGLSRQDYQARVQTNDAHATALLEEAFAERDQQLAKREALRRTFEGSGKSADEFADMYGLDKRELLAAIKA